MAKTRWIKMQKMAILISFWQKDGYNMECYDDRSDY